MRLTVERLGHLGDGIAAGPVYVPMTLPGEVVECDIAGGRATDLRIVTPSPERVTPPCGHYRACGGCALMHGSDRFVAGWKAGIVSRALAAQGLEAPIGTMHVSPPGSRRRAVLHGRRTRKGAVVGLHGRASGTLVAIPDCRVLHPALIACLPALAAMTEAGGSRKGEIALAASVTTGGVAIAATGGKPLDQSLFSTLAALAERHDLAALWWNGEAVALRREPAQIFGAARVVPPPGAFLQATAEGEAALVAAVRRGIGAAPRVVDLFAGAGTFTLPLAETAEVHAVEGLAESLAALDRGWRGASGLRRVTTEMRDLFARPLLAEELNRHDAAVIDPPRAGAEAQCRQIAASALPVVVAVSCNPVSFARDARILADGGFRLERIEIVDQFRWSPHVELVARLAR